MGFLHERLYHVYNILGNISPALGPTCSSSHQEKMTLGVDVKMAQFLPVRYTYLLLWSSRCPVKHSSTSILVVIVTCNKESPWSIHNQVLTCDWDLLAMVDFYVCWRSTSKILHPSGHLLYPQNGEWLLRYIYATRKDIDNRMSSYVSSKVSRNIALFQKYSLGLSIHITTGTLANVTMAGRVTPANVAVFSQAEIIVM